MTDETESVDAGSEASGETAVETTSTEQSGAEETTSTDAGAAAEKTTSSEASGETASDESRTGYADKGLRAGDECTCPDGRKGTVHSFDAGLICIPNAEQGE
jgi:hypothetical protein